MTGGKGRWLGGFFLIGIGVLFMLQQWGFIHFSIGEMFSTFWPIILLFIGTAALLQGGWYGLILLGVGTFFLLSNLGFVHMSFGEALRYVFPLIIIVIGLIVLFGSKGRRFLKGKEKDRDNSPAWTEKTYGDPFAEYAKNLHTEKNDVSHESGTTANIGQQVPSVEGGGIKSAFDVPYSKKKESYKYDDFDDYFDDDHDEDDYDDDFKTYKQQFTSFKKKKKIEKSGFIGDTHLGVNYWELRPTVVSHFIGDTTIDLTKAQVPYGSTKINISTFIGDVKVYVPYDMELGVRVATSSFIGDVRVLDEEQSGFMRSIQAETPHFRESSKKVHIAVSTFIGDVKVVRVG